MDEEYHQKLEENKKKAEEVTAKKRAKRLKKKQKFKQNKRLKVKDEVKSEKADTESETSEDEDVPMQESCQKSKENNKNEIVDSSNVEEIVSDETCKLNKKGSDEMETDLNSSHKGEGGKTPDQMQKESEGNYQNEEVDSLNVKKIVLDEGSKSDQEACEEVKADSNSSNKEEDKNYRRRDGNYYI